MFTMYQGLVLCNFLAAKKCISVDTPIILHRGSSMSAHVCAHVLGDEESLAFYRFYCDPWNDPQEFYSEDYFLPQKGVTTPHEYLVECYLVVY